MIKRLPDFWTPSQPGALCRLLCLLLALSGGVCGARAQSQVGSLIPTYSQYRQILINEVQANNRFTTFDRTQTAEPWIELYNSSSNTFSLDAFALSDSYYRFQKWRFPKGWFLFPGQYLKVWMDGQPDQTTRDELHSQLRLQPRGGSLVLSTLVNGKPTVVDYVDYPALVADLSFGAPPSQPGIPTTPQHRVFTLPTPGGPNLLLPPVVLNEWFVAPPTGEPWIEFYNAGRETVDLGGLVLSLSGPGFQLPAFTLPKGRRVVAGGFFRAWADAQAALNATDSRNLHLPWKLPTTTFSMSLKSPEGVLISQFTTKVTNATRPEARYPDGSTDYDSVAIATPGAPNVGLPSWIRRPASETVVAGNNFIWSAKAEGTQPITYRWFRGGAALQLIATGPELALKPATAADAGLYLCVASNPAGSITSEMVLTVLERPEIRVVAPIELPTKLGTFLRLPSEVTGSGPLTFQWKRNGVNIQQANGQDYTKEQIGIDDGGSYTAVVRNSAGVVLTVPVRVLIDVTEVKAADLFAERLSLGELPSGSLRGSNRDATKETGEPQHAGNAGGHSVWFSWRPLKSGIARLHTRGSTFDTLLGVYTGTKVSTLKRVESDDDSGGYYTSELRFNASRGVEYNIAIDGFGGDSNQFILSWELESTADQIPVVLKHPLSQTAKPGSTVEFSVSASSNTVGYQWFFDGKAIRGATESILTLTKVDIKDVGVYTVMLMSADQRTVESHEARLELGDLPRQPTEDKYEPPFAPFSLPGLASIPTVSVGAGSIGSQWLTTKGSATQLSEPPPCGAIGGNSRFQVFVLDAPNTVIIDTVGSTYNTVLTVYSIGKRPPFQYVTCDSNGSSSQVQFEGEAGLAYYAFVDSADGTTGVTQMNWRVGGVPVLLSPTPPGTNSIPSGTPFSVSIAYAAAPPISGVQWMLDDVPVSGAPDLLDIGPVSPDDAGNYSVVLSNAMGSVTGMVANLYVQVPMKLEATMVSGKEGTRIDLRGKAEQGFLVESSSDLMNWCFFLLNPVPLNPMAYTVTNNGTHPRMFFRCQPWPTPPEYTATLCLPGIP